MNRFWYVNKSIISIPLIVIMLLTSSCATSNKNLKRNTLIAVGVAAGIAAGISASSSNDGCQGDGCGGGGGFGLLFIGGLLGALFGYGLDLATTPKKQQEQKIIEKEKIK